MESREILAMKRFALILALAGLLTPAFAASSFAQDHWDHGPHGGHGDPHWGGNIHAFGDHDLAYWHSGHWFHGVHGGRNGWWWQVGAGWYFYPAPIYPYPDPFVPPVVVAVAPAAHFWYYCNHPHGYYPYVPACRVPWQAVPTY
jgi:hypothetical protein